MIRRGNYITLLLIAIVIILLMGVGISIYYVLDLDWFSKEPINIYTEPVNPYLEQITPGANIEKEIKYDIAKRTYNIMLNTEGLKIVVYKDGSVGITMLASNKYKDINIYSELVNKESKLALTNIIRAYEVEASKDGVAQKYILLLDAEGNLYELVEKELTTSGKFAFVKIEGLAKIIDVRQITNEGLVENTTGINAIAIDEESNELLLTDYLIKNAK